MPALPNRTTPAQAPRLLGYVQVRVGPEVFALAVQSVPFEKDGDAHAGGFFTEPSGQLGILVDGNASPEDIRAQITKATEDAVAHLSRRYLN